MKVMCGKLLKALQGFSLATSESCTGGGIGATITSVSGSSAVYKGGVICYANWVKENVLGVDTGVLNKYGPVSQPVAEQMVTGVKRLLQADAAISVTGLAGPDGDEYGMPVGTVFVGSAFKDTTLVKEYRFLGDREAVRQQAIEAALKQLLHMVEQ